MLERSELGIAVVRCRPGLDGYKLRRVDIAPPIAVPLTTQRPWPPPCMCPIN